MAVVLEMTLTRILPSEGKNITLLIAVSFQEIEGISLSKTVLQSCRIILTLSLVITCELAPMLSNRIDLLGVELIKLSIQAEVHKRCPSTR
jgi:hypothetical protein